MLKKELQDYLNSKDKNLLLIRHDYLNFNFNNYLSDSGYEHLIYINLGQDRFQIAKQLDQFQVTISSQLEQGSSQLILDNYDAKLNLSFFQELRLTAHPRLKIVIICKASFLELEGPHKSYINQILPEEFLDRGLKQLQEMTIPLLTTEEIFQCIRHSLSTESQWKVKHYQDLFNAIPELMDLAKYPRLLELMVTHVPKSLGLPKENYKRSDGYRLCEYLLVQWFSLSIDRLERSGQLVVSRSETEKDSWEFAEAVAGCLHEDGRHDEVIEIGDRWNPLLNGEWCVDKEAGWKRLRVAKQVCPWVVVGEGKLKFLSGFVQKILYKKKQSKYAAHLGRKDQLLSDEIKIFEYNQNEKIGKDPLNQRVLIDDQILIKLEVDNLRKNPMKRLNELKTLVDLSREDEKYASGAVNAMTVMNLAGISFSGWNLSRVKLSVFNNGRREGSNLSSGNFDSTNFEQSDLRGCNFRDTFCNKTIFKNANMESVDFGVYPTLVNHGTITQMNWDSNNRRLYCSTNLGGSMPGIQVITLPQEGSHELPTHVFWRTTYAISNMTINSSGNELLYLVGSNLIKLANCHQYNTSGYLTLKGQEIFDKMDVVSSIKTSLNHEMLSICVNDSLEVWRIKTEDACKVKVYLPETVLDASFSWDNRLIAAVSDRGTLAIYNLPELSLLAEQFFGNDFELLQVMFIKNNVEVIVLANGNGKNSDNSQIFIYNMSDNSYRSIKLRKEPIKLCLDKLENIIFLIDQDNMVSGFDLINSSLVYRHKINLKRNYKVTDLFCTNENGTMIIYISSEDGQLFKIAFKNMQYKHSKLIIPYNFIFIPKLDVLASYNNEDVSKYLLSFHTIKDGAERNSICLKFNPSCIAYDSIRHHLVLGGAELEYDEKEYMMHMFRKREPSAELDGEATAILSAGVIKYFDITTMSFLPDEFHLKTCVTLITTSQEIGTIAFVTRDNILWTQHQQNKANFQKSSSDDAINVLSFVENDQYLILGKNKTLELFDITENHACQTIDVVKAVLCIALNNDRGLIFINTISDLARERGAFSGFSITDGQLYIKIVFAHPKHREVRSVAYDVKTQLLASGDNEGNVFLWDFQKFLKQVECKTYRIKNILLSYKLVGDEAIVSSVENYLYFIESMMMKGGRLIVYDGQELALTVWRIENSGNSIRLILEWTSLIPKLVLMGADFDGAKGISKSNRIVLSQFFAKNIHISDRNMPETIINSDRSTNYMY